jgi:hypothetical protein
MSALKYHIFKPQNLRDFGSESAIDPINPLVYIQASNLLWQSFKKILHIVCPFSAKHSKINQ